MKKHLIKSTLLATMLFLAGCQTPQTKENVAEGELTEEVREFKNENSEPLKAVAFARAVPLNLGGSVVNSQGHFFANSARSELALSIVNNRVSDSENKEEELAKAVEESQSDNEENMAIVSLNSEELAANEEAETPVSSSENAAISQPTTEQKAPAVEKAKPTPAPEQAPEPDPEPEVEYKPLVTGITDAELNAFKNEINSNSYPYASIYSTIAPEGEYHIYGHATISMWTGMNDVVKHVDDVS